ncbi:MAG: AraC family transcriptional regulator [Lachnospiraceae bacterium]|nr:AraC family transcriptional regulator [Lachnospiraceae bacterium]
MAIFTIRQIDNIALITTDKRDRREIPKTIFSVALREICPEKLCCFYCGDAGSFIALFYCTPGQEVYAEVLAVCKDLCRFMEEGYGIRSHVAISSPTADCQNLPEAFRQAKKLEQFSVTISSTSDMICEDKLTESVALSENNFISQEQLLVNTLLIGKYEAVPSIVKTILSEQVASLSSDYNAADHRLQIISGILAEWLHDRDPQGAETADAISRLWGAVSIDALNAEVEQIFLMLKAQKSEPEEMERIVADACNYITRHLDDPNMNVTLICDSVNTIPQRLTPLFQEQFHMGIAEYVNDRRVERAKELLLATKQTVRQIGENVGYTTSDTFVRNFKKREKLTPTEFRKLKASQT